MITKPRILPPDVDLQRLSAAVNARLEPGIAVSFFRVMELDGSFETGIIYQCGDRRAVTRTRNVLGDEDEDEDAILQGISAWVAGVQNSNRWTMDSTEAA